MLPSSTLNSCGAVNSLFALFRGAHAERVRVREKRERGREREGIRRNQAPLALPFFGGGGGGGGRRVCAFFPSCTCCVRVDSPISFITTLSPSLPPSPPPFSDLYHLFLFCVCFCHSLFLSLATWRGWRNKGSSTQHNSKKGRRREREKGKRRRLTLLAFLF